ncbi:MAG: laccase domain-containing protein [Tindallia sp. MSAO_Bac2]|nr:MAG: laccase domain-containing protein [Tindallia sp. MSAO_Bac2]
MDFNKKQFNWYWNQQVEYGAFLGWDKKLNITHGFSTRHGGVSEGCYKSMNLGFASGDKEELIIENFKRFSQALKIDWKNLVLSDQIHETEIRVVSEQDIGSGIIRLKKYKGIDGLITNVPGIPLATFHADCTSLFYIDAVKRVAGVAHAGWRGAFAGMAGKMAHRMKTVYGSKAENIQVGIGPGIGKCCFLIREDVYNQIKVFPQYVTRLSRVNDEQWRLSLESVHENFLKLEGIPTGNIFKSGICTCCEKERLFSHRRMGEERGNHAAVIQLNS